MTDLINPQTAQHIAVPFFERCRDIFRDRERIKIEWTAPDYKRISILGGLFEFESGERKTFIIEGPPGFCRAALRELRSAGGEIKAIGKSRVVEWDG